MFVAVGILHSQLSRIRISRCSGNTEKTLWEEDDLP